MRSPVNVIASKAIRNYCINGQFDFAQRKPSGNWLNEGDRYTADRWFRTRDGGGNAGTNTTIQSAVDGRKSINISRTSGSSDVNKMTLIQALESIDSKDLAGRTVTFSYRIRKGVGFTGADFTGSLEMGTGTDQSVSGAWTGQSQIGVLVTPAASISTATFTQFFFSVQVPSNATQLRMLLQYTPTGTAGASDYMEIMDVMLNIGDFTPYVRAGSSYENELALCQRYYEKSFELNTQPLNGGASTFSTDSGLERVPVLPWVASPNVLGAFVKFRQTKRSQPGLTTYGNSSGFWGYNGVNTIVAQNGAMLFSTQIGLGASSSVGFWVFNNVSTNSLFGVQGHWTADAEL